MEAECRSRRFLVGPEVLPAGGTHFRVWAPCCQRVEVIIESDERRIPFTLNGVGDGYFAELLAEAGDGTLYRFRLDGDDRSLYPDPVSRFQPLGPHGPSCVIDPTKFCWTDAGWKGASIKGQVIYEMHIGSFTREGTWKAAARELNELAALGVTCIEMMPIAEFPGRFGWGYDGVDLFAPSHLYGEPNDLRRFVDAAHRAGLAVILDVVYNHFGPDGNYLRHFSPHYFSDRKTDWGEAINFDGPRSEPVREFFLANARYWIQEFHFDGLRLDATQSLFDSSPEHIISRIAREVRAVAHGRETLIVAENEPQHTRLVRDPAQGGYGLDSLWNDDFHHSAMVALTGRSEAYYSDYRGTPQELISAVKYGYLFQGQRYKWQRQRRGTPTFDLPPAAFVNFIQNHDQVANSARGERIHHVASAGSYRAMTALMLLAPGTPMLFQGQEFAATAPFHYFADHPPELAALVRRGRAEFLAQFRSVATPETHSILDPPELLETFEHCKLDLTERESHKEIYEMHRDLLRLRRTDAVFQAQRPHAVDGAVLSSEAFVLRFFGEAGDDRLLWINLGADLNLNPAPEPLLAPPAETIWTLLWSSEDVRYGGTGTPPLETKDNWQIPGRAAVVLIPVPADATNDLARGGDGPSEEEETRQEALRGWNQ